MQSNGNHTTQYRSGDQLVKCKASFLKSVSINLTMSSLHGSRQPPLSTKYSTDWPRWKTGQHVQVVLLHACMSNWKPCCLPIYSYFADVFSQVSILSISCQSCMHDCLFYASLPMDVSAWDSTKTNHKMKQWSWEVIKYPSGKKSFCFQEVFAVALRASSRLTSSSACLCRMEMNRNVGNIWARI